MTEPKQAVAVRAEAESIARRESPDAIADLMRLALDKNVPVEALEKLVALHERVADRMAAQEFAQALADFQRECPAIKRSSTANVATKSGAKFSYKYAELDEIAATVSEPLHKRGLSFAWDSTVDAKGLLTCICTLRHANGYHITASFSAPTESEAGMSPAQKYAAALTFARRQSLVQVLGLTTTDADQDGRAPEDLEFITDKQVADIEALIQEVRGNRAAFLKVMGAERIQDIRAHQLKGAIYMLEQKRGAAR